MTADSLRQRCSDLVIQQAGELVQAVAPDGRLPLELVGGPIGDDACVELVHLLHQLTRAGISRIGGHEVPALLWRAMDRIRLDGVHTFGRYRLAEALLRWGGWDGNAYVQSCRPQRRQRLRNALDPEPDLAAIGVSLPRNYFHVYARNQLARARLLHERRPALAAALERCRQHLRSAPRGILDDSTRGRGRYDLYAIEALLVSHTFRGELGPGFERCWRASGRLVELTFDAGGTVPWGRSSGPFGRAAALLFSVLMHHDSGDARWLQRAVLAVEAMRSDFAGGWACFLQNAGTDGYRGLDRWLQASLDLLAKVAEAAALAPQTELSLWSADLPAPHSPLRDHAELLRFDAAAAVWSVRRGTTSVVLPLVSGHTSEYAATPRAAGRLEQPVDSPVLMLLPILVVDGRRYATRGAPTEIEVAGDLLTATWSDVRDASGSAAPLPVRRCATFGVDGRTVRATERWQITGGDGAVVVHVGVAGDAAPTLELSPDATVTSVDTHGVAQLRTRSGSFSAVQTHSKPVASGADVTFSWSVTTAPRVGVLGFRHPYVRGIYAAMGDRIASRRVDPAHPEPATLDVVHVHWPEHLLGGDLAAHRRLISDLKRSRILIAWTAHNLMPHDGTAADLYAHWASAADIVVHHSDWGMTRIRARYRFPGAQHVVIPHPHFGHLVSDTGTPAAAARSLGWPQGPIRLAALGAHRPYRDLPALLAAFQRVRRPDLRLVVPGSAIDARSDPRLIAVASGYVDRAHWDVQLRACDALVLPHYGGDGLSSGLLADAVALGLPVLTPDWGYAAEYLRGAAIGLGEDPAETTRVLESLDRDRLAEAAARMDGLKADYDVRVIADRFAGLFEASV